MGERKVSLWQSYKENLMSALQKAITKAGFPVQDKIAVEMPREREHGDLATTVALQLARSVKKAPRSVAESIIQCLKLPAEWEKISLAGPGFINVTLTTPAITPFTHNRRSHTYSQSFH